MLVDVDNIKRLADNLTVVDEGTLTIATTHTQARYACYRRFVNQFKKRVSKSSSYFATSQPCLKLPKCSYKVKRDIGIATVITDHRR